MMKRIILIAFLLGTFLRPIESFAEGPKFNPKMKAFLLMTAYGAVGGFLLGTASLAFETPGRAPFIGASLGLYAGLSFGSYVLASHYVEKDRKLNPHKYIDESGPGDYGELPNQMLNQYIHEQGRADLRQINQMNKKSQKALFFSLLNTSF